MQAERELALELGHLDGAAACHDVRLEQATALLNRGAVSVLSLDVFDTLLWRAVPRPTDLFVVLAHELREAGLLHRCIEPDVFRLLRIRAEARARQRQRELGLGPEVTLEDIWREIPPGVVGPAPAGALARMEVGVERRLTFPDLDVLALASLARGLGVDIALVSNTYLSPQQLRILTSRAEMQAVAGAHIFASSSHGVHKGDGLFEVVLAALEVPGSSVLHVGDEKESDVDAPGRLGIHTVHFRRFRGDLEQVLVDEGCLLPLSRAPSPVVVHPTRGDFGMTALRTKAAAVAQPAELPAPLRPAWEFGVTVFGPVLLGFADWVHRHARQMGADSVWCMMREGEFLSELVNGAAAHHDSPVVARPIWMSRHVTARASIFLADREELEAQLQRRLRPRVSEFLDSLGLDIGEVAELRGSLSRRLDEPGFIDRVFECIIGNDHLRARVREEAAAARRRLLDYLSETVGDIERLVLVDLGWGGTIQRQLEAVLQGSGSAMRTVGLYLMTNDSASGRVLDGLEMHSYLAHCGQPWPGAPDIARTPEVIEQACLATIGSLVDFSADRTPVLDRSVPTPRQVTEKVAVQQGVKTFQREWSRYRRSLPGMPGLDGAERPLLLEILRRSVVRPTVWEAETFGQWAHEDNFGSEHQEVIINDELAPLVSYLSPTDVLELSMNQCFWPIGLAARHDPPLAASALALAEGALPTEAFKPGRSATMEMWVDTGQGFAHGQQRPLLINRNGLSYGRFFFSHRGIRAIRFDPCRGAALVRLDWIDVAVLMADADQTVRFRIQGEDDFSGLTYVNCRWLYDGVVLGSTEDPQLHLSLAGRVSGDVRAAEVTVAFAVVQLPTRQPDVPLVTAGLTSYGKQMRRAVQKARAEYAEGGAGAVAQGLGRVVKRGLGRP